MGDSIVLMGSFQDLERAADALDQLRALDITDQDITVLSSLPYSHKAMGRPEVKTWLPVIAMASAAVGLLAGLFFTVVTPHLYVIRVGGQPIVTEGKITGEFNQSNINEESLVKASSIGHEISQI